MNLFYETPDGRAKLYLGDAIEVMASFPDACVDAIVTDPPYGLEFMGKEWDAPWAQKIGLGEHNAGFGAVELADGAERLPWPTYLGGTNPSCRNCGGTRFGQEKEGGRKRCRCNSPDFPNIALPRAVAYQSWTTAWATEAYRILKPGAYMLVMGGTRTHHRLGCGLEDAGFEIRDELAWIYASGFPKNYDVSKGIDKTGKRRPLRKRNQDFDDVRVWLRSKVKERGLTHKEIDTALGNPNSHIASHLLGTSQPMLPTREQWLIIKELLGVDEDIDRAPQYIESKYIEYERAIIGYRQVNPGLAFTSEGPTQLPVTIPATPQAQYWEGYGTALKPAHEPVWLCKKPNEGTYVDNVLKHGCGCLNIDGCRVEYQGDSRAETRRQPIREGSKHNWTGERATPYDSIPSGRWPANVLVDCYPEEFIGGAVIEGWGKGDWGQPRERCEFRGPFQRREGELRAVGYKDEIGNGLLGPYTRFFVIPKPSKAEKNRGCMELYWRKEKGGGHIQIDREEWDELVAEEKRIYEETGKRVRLQARGNIHVTVKPVRLGKWLIKLITPHQHPVVVLDLFCGSGSFLVSGSELNREEGYQIEFHGIDKEANNMVIAKARLEAEGRYLL